jgi:N-acetylglucosaminyl-diphospho-decaprenol L-rhamnosyltransferase
MSEAGPVRDPAPAGSPPGAGSVDVVIVAYRSRDVIGECIDRVVASGAVRSVTVVDHGTDGSADVAAARGAAVLRNPANPGFGAGQNAGSARGRAPFVLLLNPDARLAQTALRDGLGFLADHPDAAVVQGVIWDDEHGVAERSQGVELGPLHLLGRAVGARGWLRWPAVRWLARRSAVLADHADRVPASPRSVESLAATAWLARRDALDAVGGFDEGYFLYGEDLDLGRRLRSAGWALWALPVPWATHTAGASSSTFLRREVEWWSGTLRFAARWWSPVEWCAALGAVWLRALGLVIRSPRATGTVVSKLVVGPLRDRRNARPRPR